MGLAWWVPRDWFAEEDAETKRLIEGFVLGGGGRGREIWN